MFTRSTLTTIAAAAVAITIGATTIATPVGAESPPDWTLAIAHSIDEGADSSRVGIVPERPEIAPVGGLTARPTGPTPPGPQGPTGYANTGVAGESTDAGPSLGQPLVIVGVETDDVLNFRLAPSPDADVVVSHSLALTEFDMYALGEAWAAPSGVWWKVNVMGTVGWANQDYLGVRAGSAPIFDEVASDLQILMFESAEDLALDVAATRASIDPESRVVIITEPSIMAIGDGGGIGSVFVDVLDLGDDVKKGERLLVEFHVVYDEETPELDDIAFVVLTGVEMIWIQGVYS